MLKDTVKQLQLLQKLMKDENFRALISHPKVKGMLMDPEFHALAKSKDMAAISAHPKFGQVMRDPEVAPLIAKLDLPSLLSGLS
jgi:hypothetical protein